MGYFVTIQKDGGKQTIYALGPFNRHGDAECAVGWVRRYVHEKYPHDRDLPWCGWGTSHVKYGPMPVGVMNEAVGLPVGRIAETPLAPNRWWIAGEQPEIPIRRYQRRPRRAA